MDLKKTIDYIIKDLREARDIIDDLKNYPEVPLIQIELAKSKCKSAEELISLLKNSEEPVSHEAEPVIYPAPGQEETVIEDLMELDMNEINVNQIVEPSQPVSNLQTGN